MFNNIYSELIKSGMLPKDIKNIVIEEFDELMINKKNIEEKSINYLLPDLINLLKLKETSFYDVFLEFLDMLNIVKRKNFNQAINSIEIFSHNIEKAHYEYWINYSLERESSNLNLEEFAKYTFDLIKDIIEIMIKPYCSYTLHNIYIINGKNNSLSNIKEKSLGNLVNEIIQSKYLLNVFELKIHTLSNKKNIRLNTLRNIAAHNDYIVIENEIICYIRNSKNQIIDQFKLKREELQKILIDIMEAFRALKLGYSIFFIDNLNYINPDNIPFQYIRKEQHILNTFSGIQSQGFEIIEFIDNTKESKLVLLELLENEKVVDRSIHSSQFLYYLWQITKSDKNIIEYRNNNNEPIASFKIDGKFCEKIEDGSIQMLEIAKEMKIKKFNF